MGTTTQLSTLVRKGWMGPALGVVMAATSSQAAISFKLSSAQIESPAVLVESDFFDGDPTTNLYQAPASVDVIFGRKVTDPAIVGTFRVAYAITDSDDNKVKLVTTGADPFEAYSASFNINMTGNDTDEEESVVVHFDPTEILDQAPGYRLVTKLQEFDGTNWNFVNIPDGVSPEEPILHFTQKFSNDSSWNIEGMLTEVEWQTTSMVTGGTPSGFEVTAEALVGRYDEFNLPIDNVGSVLEWDFDLRLAGSSAQIPLLNDGVMQQVYKPDSYVVQGGRPFPVLTPAAKVTTTLIPQTQLESVNGDYVLSCTLRYLQGSGSTFLEMSELDADEEQVMQFNGNLTTAGVDGVFDEISNSPARGATGLGYVETQIRIPAGAGLLPGAPELQFGSNDLLTVRLKPNGDAAIENGSYDVTRTAAPASPWEGTVGSYPVVYGDLTLSIGGLHADGVTVAFGQGTVLMQYLAQRDTKRGQSSFTFPGPSVLLDASAQLATDLNAVLPADSEIASEDFPMITRVSDLTLTQTGALQFTPVSAEYIHADALTLLVNEAAAGLHNDAEMKVRRSNDGYFRFVDGVDSSEVGFALAADGTSRFEGTFSVGQGQFLPHFPTETEITWTGGTSALVLEDGEFANGSQLTLPNDISLSYETTCEGDPCATEGDGEVAFALTPVSLSLGFVEGGGIVADGFVDPNQNVEWGARGDGMGGTGEPTHEVNPGGFGYFFMPGQHLYAADNTAADLFWVSETAAVQGPDLLLNANATLPAFPPAVTAYHLYGSQEAVDGEGLFGGLNFLGLPSNELATSRLGGGEMTYLLDGDSKYYARYSGITGRHLATPGSYQPTEIYGYDFDFSNFELTFLSSEPRISEVEGQLSVDGATTFSQRFLELTMSCTGDLGPAELDPTDLGDKPLIYWGGQFTPRTMTFAKGPPAQPCATPPAKLVFGATVSVSNIPTPLSAPIGIENDGRLTTIETAFEGVDSRFGIPPRLDYGADGSEKYSLATSGKLYFNDPTEDEIDGPGVPSGGFATFGCSVNIPYFRNLVGQAITYPSGLASASGNSLLYFTPGWTEGGTNMFSSTRFDPTCKGWPRGPIDFADYREPDENVAEQYLLKATQKMFGLVDLNYPLRWDAGGMFFESMETKSSDVFVAQLDHEVSFLDAQFADLSFGASYDGLPRIRLGDVLNDQVNEVSDVMTQALSRAGQPGGLLKGTIDVGLEGFDKLLGDTFEAALAGKLEQIESEVLESLYQNIALSYSVNRDLNLQIEAGTSVGTVLTFEEWRDGELSDILDTALFDLDSSSGVLVDSLNALGDGIGEANSFLSEVDQVVLDLIAMIDTLVNQVQVVDGRVGYVENVAVIPSQDVVRGLLQEFEPSPGADPSRVFFVEMVKLLLIEMTPPEIRVVIEPLLVAGANEFIDELNALLEEIEPSLARLVTALNQVRTVLVNLHNDLDNGIGIATVFSDLVTGAADEIEDISEAVRERAEGVVVGMAASSALRFDAGLHLGTELFVTGNANVEVGDLGQERFVRSLTATLRDELLASELVRQFRFQNRHIFFDLEARVATALQSIFSQANEVMSGLVKSSLGGIDAEFNEFLGSAGDFIGSGDLEGFARIRGDSLRQLRLDGDFQFMVPEEMELHAYLEVNNVTAEDNFTENGCLSPGQRAVEIKVGATDVGIDWFADDLRAELVELRLSLKDFENDPFDFPIPNGMGGTFIIDGGFDFQGFDVSNVRGTFGLAVDPEMPLNSECYIGGGASMELSGYGVTGAIFFGRTCTLEPLRLVDPDLAELLGSAPFTGGYLYGETHLPISEALLGIPATCLFEISADLGAGAFFFVEGPVFGGKMAAGVSGEALCLVSIGGRVDMIGLMDDGKMKYSGTGTVRGKAGSCPFCLRYSKSVKITYRDGDWSVDL